MYSTLVPMDGQPPVKAVFDATDATDGDPAALLAAHTGAIKQFAAGARQQRALSDQAVVSIRKPLPGGGHLEYSHNNGQETVRVKLTSRPLVGNHPVTVPILEPHPTLLIDVIFQPEFYMAGDVYSFVKDGPGVTLPHPNGPDDPSENWVTLQVTTVAALQAYFQNQPFYDGFGILNRGRWQGTPNYRPDGSNGHVTGGVYDPNTNNSFDGFSTDFPAAPPYDQDTCVDWVEYYHNTRQNNPDGSYFSGSFGGFVILNVYTAPHANQYNYRDQYFYYDVQNVVGLVGDPEGHTPYECVSIGTTTDKRLKPLMQSGADISIVRAATAAGSVPPGISGVGFSATSTTKIHAGGSSPPPTIIDVYVASENTIKTNTFPGTQTTTFSDDDPTFTYSTKDDLICHIQVRELINSEQPIIVRVATTMERKRIGFGPEGPGPTKLPTVQGPDDISDDTRDHAWKFGASKGWIDTGGDPTDPSQTKGDGKVSSMGKLLAASTVLKPTVVGPPGNPRKVFEAVEWTTPVKGMTKVARITWSPSAKLHTNGMAKIDPP